MTNRSLLPNEAITFALRSLYDRYGYSRYKMNKFEEYDLYARNKDFLISDSVITFDLFALQSIPKERSNALAGGYTGSP